MKIENFNFLLGLNNWFEIAHKEFFEAIYNVIYRSHISKSKCNTTPMIQCYFLSLERTRKPEQEAVSCWG